MSKSIAEQFPKGAWVIFDHEGAAVEGYVKATTPKGGGRVGLAVAWQEGLLWRSPEGLKVIGDDERVLECHKCSGSGLYYFGGAVVNGVYTGRTGPCHACEGHGKQTPKDRHRNRVYWSKYARISL